MEQLMIFESSLSFHGSWADAEDDNIADYWGGRMLKN
jgi:hypothetical protein